MKPCKPWPCICICSDASHQQSRLRRGPPRPCQHRVSTHLYTKRYDSQILIVHNTIQHSVCAYSTFMSTSVCRHLAFATRYCEGILLLAHQLDRAVRIELFMSIFIHQKMVETHKKKRKYSNNKKTLTISNGEHIRHTLSTSKHDRHQQH